MKKLLQYFFLLTFLSTGLLLSCNEGDVGNDGPDARDEIVRRWRCTEDVASGDPPVYDVDIFKTSASTTQVTLDNFGNFGVGLTITATMNNLVLTIDEGQTIADYQISGTGTIASNYKTVDWSFTISDGVVEETVTATFREQDIIVKSNLVE